MKKTILITLSRGSLVRNILKTDCTKRLEQAGVRIVLLTPENADTHALKNISPNIICETLHEAPWTRMDFLLNGMFKSIAYNRHTRANDMYGIFNFSESSVFKYWVRKIIFLPLSKIQTLKRMLRWIDDRLVYSGHYKQLFDTYQPDVVFATSIVGDTDIEVVKEAKRRNIPVAGMPKSWDNLPKVCLRVAPDILLVWGERSRYEAQKFSGIQDSSIKVVGASQFDHYFRPELRVSREEFCESWGLNPQKKIIMFGSEGKVMAHDGEVADMIARAIDNEEIKNAQLIMRPHFIYNGDAQKFAHIHSPNAVMDSSWNPDAAFRDRWDYSDEQIARFTNLMYHADVVVTSVSTLSVDACVNKKPVINYYFDGTHNMVHERSMRRWYEREHYYHIVESQAVSIAWDKDDMIELINQYLIDPSMREQQRALCAEYVGGPMDGKAGERMGDILLSMLESVQK